MNVRRLVGSGDRIGLVVLPFLVIGVVLNIAFPKWFGVGGPPPALWLISLAALGIGMAIWLWSAVLILTKVPHDELITTGPYAVMKHPLYTAVALLVLPSIGMLFNTWLGAALGIVLYIGARVFAPAEEQELAARFEQRWDQYVRGVVLPWV